MPPIVFESPPQCSSSGRKSPPGTTPDHAARGRRRPSHAATPESGEPLAARGAGRSRPRRQSSWRTPNPSQAPALEPAASARRGRPGQAQLARAAVRQRVSPRACSSLFVRHPQARRRPAGRARNHPDHRRRRHRGQHRAGRRPAQAHAQARVRRRPRAAGRAAPGAGRPAQAGRAAAGRARPASRSWCSPSASTAPARPPPSASWRAAGATKAAA